MKYGFGHINPHWSDEVTEFDYHYAPVPDANAIQEWTDLGYDKFCNLQGQVFPYNKVDSLTQPFQSLQPNWQNIGMTFFKMLPGDALPTHTDAYLKYRQMYNLNADQVWRCVVFLEDWKTGHYFEIDSKAFVNWKAGDFVYWQNNVPHYAGNFGHEPRYTLQITGHV